MDFFRHDTDAGHGRFLTEAVEKFGHFGYAGFFLILELYYDKINGTKSSEIRKYLEISDDSSSSVRLWYGFHWRVVRQRLRSTPTRVEDLLNYCQTSGVLLWRESPTGVEISVCNLLELLPDKMRRQITKIIACVQEERRREKKREEERRGEESEELTLLPPQPISPPSEIHPLGEIWNQHRDKLAKIKTTTKARLKKCKARWSDTPEGEDPTEYWSDIVKRIAASDFCNGKSDRAWLADFDWLMQPDVHGKVDLGRYDNRTGYVSTNQSRKTANNAALMEKFRGK